VAAAEHEQMAPRASCRQVAAAVWQKGCGLASVYLPLHRSKNSALVPPVSWPLQTPAAVAHTYQTCIDRAPTATAQIEHR
jgi:hypothetical protein